eukprot:Sspe_Gene.57597::Locus_31590_Transcript_2_2_Confidence_0.667_Length_589::g.57597::m.57597
MAFLPVYPYHYGIATIPEPQVGGHKSISVEKELRDRGLHASANAVGNLEPMGPGQAAAVHVADADLHCGSPHRFRTPQFVAHMDAEIRQPYSWPSPHSAVLPVFPY